MGERGMRIQFKFAAVSMLVGVACRALIWLFVENKNFNVRRAAREPAGAQNTAQSEPHSDPEDLDADLAIAHRMVVAFGIALLGSIGVYLTTIEPESVGTGMITAAAANRAGAIVSVTQVDFEERSVRAEISRDQSRRQQVSSVDGNVAEYRMASRSLSSARHHCFHAHGLCSP
jgi:hypothetical protein